MKKTSVYLLAVAFVVGLVWLGCGTGQGPLGPGSDQAGSEELAPLTKKGGGGKPDKGGTRFDVTLTLQGDGDIGSVDVVGPSEWPGLGAFFTFHPDTPNPLIRVGGRNLTVVQISANKKGGKIVSVILFFRDDGDGTQYQTRRIALDPPVTPDIGGFLLPIHNEGESALVYPYGPKNKVQAIGSVYAAGAVYYRQ